MHLGAALRTNVC